jgi:hypothetical protein
VLTDISRMMTKFHQAESCEEALAVLDLDGLGEASAKSQTLH